MPSNSRPSLTDPNPNSTYLFSVARLLRTRPNTVRSSTPPPRELILRTPPTKLRPLRTNHPYKRIHNTSNSDRENHQPAPVDDRFLEAIALLAQNENEDHIQDAHPPVPPQRWYVRVFDFFVTLPVKIRDSRAVQYVFPTRDNL